MRRFRSLAVAVLAVFLLGTLLAPPAPAQDDKVRIAVLNFENNSTWHYWGDNLGKAAADELVTQLFKTDRFRVIERAQIEAILQEQNFGQSGRVDSSTAAQIGQVLGVQAVLTGSITQFSIERVSGGFAGIGGSYSRAESMVDVRLIDTNTAEIVLADEGQGEKRMGGGFFRGAGAEREFDAGAAQEALRPAIEEITQKIVDQYDRLAAIQSPTPPGAVVGANEGQIYIDRGENYDVRVGDRFEVFRVVDEITDAQGNVLDRITEKIGVVEVTRVLSQSSICTIVEGEAAEGDSIQKIG